MWLLSRGVIPLRSYRNRTRLCWRRISPSRVRSLQWSWVSRMICWRIADCIEWFLLLCRHQKLLRCSSRLLRDKRSPKNYRLRSVLVKWLWSQPAMHSLLKILVENTSTTPILYAISDPSGFLKNKYQSKSKTSRASNRSFMKSPLKHRSHRTLALLN